MDDQYLRISEAILPETVDKNINDIVNKDQAIQQLADMLDKANLLNEKDLYLQSVYDHEKMGPTYMEHFIAIPHGKSDAAREVGISFGRSEKGFHYDTPLGGGVTKKVYFAGHIPNLVSDNVYIDMLVRLARLLVHEIFKNYWMKGFT